MRISTTSLWVLLFCLGCGCGTIPDSTVMNPALYRVNIGDKVLIDVYNEPDISRSFDVGADGSINHPLLGRVPVAGLSVAQVESRVYALLEADYLVDPRVSVTIASSSNRPIMVFGEVRNPGIYEIRAGQRQTLLQVIASAGGFTDIAALDRVRIVRVLNGKEHTIKVKVTDLLRGRDGVTDIDLRAGDVVTVPETLF